MDTLSHPSRPLDADAHFPQDPDLAEERIRIAWIQGQWVEMASLCDRMRRRFPDRPGGYTMGLTALRMLGRLDMAVAVADSAEALFPTDPRVWAESGLLALARRAGSQALDRFAQMRDRFPELPTGYSLGILTLREIGALGEAKALAEAALERFPDEVELLLERSRVEWTRNDLPEALRYCSEARSRNPENVAGWALSVTLLRLLHRVSEAEELLEQALRLFPHDVSLWAERVVLASQGANSETGVRRVQEMRSQFPDALESYTVGASVLREAGQFEAATALLAQAVMRFPDEPQLLIERAWISASQSNWEESAAQWQEVRERFPDRPEGYAMRGMALRRMGRFEEAQALVNEARERFPEDRNAALEDAWIATEQENLSEAQERWRRVREEFPTHPEGYSMGTMVLLRAGLHAQAEELSTLGVASFPDDPDMHIQSALAAVERCDWSEAQRRWELVHARFPHREEGRSGLESLRLLRELEESGLPEEEDAPADTSRPRVACIMMQKDEELLLEPWLAYHGYLFGFENLIVYDNGSTLDTVKAVLRKYAAAGVVVITDRDSADDFSQKGWILSAKIRQLQRRRKYDVVFPMDCDEFVCITCKEGFSCNRSEINRYLAGLEPGKIYRVGRSLTNQPGSSTVFRVMSHSKSVISLGRFKQMDHGFHQAELEGATDYQPTRLVNIHMHNKPFETLLEHARMKLRPFVDVDDPEALEKFDGVGIHLKHYFSLTEAQYRGATGGWPLVRFSGFARLLSVLIDFDAFDAAWCGTSSSAAVPAELPEVIEIEGNFDARAYIAANPDVERAGLDPVIHYVEVGSREGRSVHAGA